MIETLKKRAEFLRVRGGARWACPAFVLETKPRPAVSVSKGGVGGCEGNDRPRFGFTVTKKLGGAVVRNLIRRRLREALRIASPGSARPGHDYVIVARQAAVSREFAALCGDLERAFAKVHAPGAGRGEGTGSPRKPAKPPRKAAKEENRSA